MCMVSFVGRGASETLPERYPWIQPIIQPTTTPPVVLPSNAQIEALRREMRELRDLLIAAKAFDKATGQPDCEVEEKVALLRRIAELVDVDLEDVLA